MLLLCFIFLLGISCGEPVVNSHTTKTGDIFFTDIVTYECNIGYEFFSGSYQRTCQGHGVWADQPLFCTSKNLLHHGSLPSFMITVTLLLFPCGDWAFISLLLFVLSLLLRWQDYLCTVFQPKALAALADGSWCLLDWISQWTKDVTFWVISLYCSCWLWWALFTRPLHQDRYHLHIRC